MAEILNVLDASGSDINPYVPPSGWQVVNDSFRRINNSIRLNVGTSAVIRDNKILAGSKIGARIRTALIDVNSMGCALLNDAGTGYALFVNNASVRLFSVTAYVANTGTVLYTIPGIVPAAGKDVDLLYDTATGNYTFRYDGSPVGVDYDAVPISGLKAHGFSRGSAAGFSSLTSIEETAFLLEPVSTPIVPGASSPWTASGFTNGSATLSFGGVSIPVTVTAEAFNAPIPMLADNTDWPRLPSASTAFTLTQGATTASVNAPISLPVGYDVVRDGSNNPANFAGLIGDSDKYLQYGFVAALNPLTTNDTAYPPFEMRLNPATNQIEQDLIIGQDSGINAMTSTLPRTFILPVHRADGKIYMHEVVLSKDGGVVSVKGMTGASLKASKIRTKAIKATKL